MDQELSPVTGSRRIGRLIRKAKTQGEKRAVTATKAVGYVRVSTEEQAQHGFGLAAQEKAVRAFAESQGYELLTILTDPGVSGATRPADRPGFAQVVELAEKDAFSVLLVYRFDRLARQIIYAVTAVHELAEKSGVVIRSVTEPIDTATPMGRTVFAILAGMAEAEREAITERTKGGRISKANEGGYACGRVPYGYRLASGGGLTVYEPEAKIVRRIIRARRTRPRTTLRALALMLNMEGVPGPKGGAWHASSVSYVADNPKYRGAIEYLFRSSTSEQHVLTKGKHKAIV